MTIRWETELGNIISEFSADIGTIHKLDPHDQHLYLVVASQAVPEEVLKETRRIAVGKGIAGVAAQTKSPVSICNLQKDTQNIAKPNARKTHADGTICVPIFKGDEVVGTLGLANFRKREFTEQEIDNLTNIGRKLADKLLESKS